MKGGKESEGDEEWEGVGEREGMEETIYRMWRDGNDKGKKGEKKKGRRRVSETGVVRPKTNVHKCEAIEMSRGREGRERNEGRRGDGESWGKS